MPLQTTVLQDQIKAAFKKAKDTPPPDDPADADQLQEDILTELAADLAVAILAFLQSGDVVGVRTDVQVDTSTGRGQGTQTGVGRIQ